MALSPVQGLVPGSALPPGAAVASLPSAVTRELLTLAGTQYAQLPAMTIPANYGMSVDMYWEQNTANQALCSSFSGTADNVRTNGGATATEVNFLYRQAGTESTLPIDPFPMNKRAVLSWEKTDTGVLTVFLDGVQVQQVTNVAYAPAPTIESLFRINGNNSQYLIGKVFNVKIWELGGDVLFDCDFTDKGFANQHNKATGLNEVPLSAVEADWSVWTRDDESGWWISTETLAFTSSTDWTLTRDASAFTLEEAPGGGALMTLIDDSGSNDWLGARSTQYIEFYSQYRWFLTEWDITNNTQDAQVNVGAEYEGVDMAFPVGVRTLVSQVHQKSGQYNNRLGLEQRYAGSNGANLTIHSAQSWQVLIDAS